MATKSSKGLSLGRVVGGICAVVVAVGITRLIKSDLFATDILTVAMKIMGFLVSAGGVYWLLTGMIFGEPMPRRKGRPDPPKK